MNRRYSNSTKEEREEERRKTLKLIEELEREGKEYEIRNNARAKRTNVCDFD